MIERDNCDCLQRYCSAQNFHGIAAHADVGNAFAFPRCSDIHLTWTAALGALANHHLLVTLCDSMFYQPTGRAPGRRARGRVFAAVKKHSSSRFKPAFTAFGTNEVKEVRPGILQKFRCLCIAKPQIRECRLIAEWHDRKRQSCRDGLYRPFRRNFVNSDSNDASNLFSRKRSSKFGIALAHFTEHQAVDSIASLL